MAANVLQRGHASNPRAANAPKTFAVRELESRRVGSYLRGNLTILDLK